VSRQGDPNAALDPEAVDPAASPDTDQGAAEPTEPTQATKPLPDDPTLLRRAYTQSQQRWADLRKRFELPKDATPEDIIAAVEARASAKAAAPGEDGDEERIPMAAALEAEARATAAEWRYQSVLYPGTAEAAREFAELARSEHDPEALTQKFYELLNRFAAPAAGDDGAQPGAPQGAVADDQGEPAVVDVGLGEGPAAVSPSDAAALERLKGTGRIAEGMRHIPGWDRLVGRPSA
jgi:hypothetical protein